MSMTRRVLCRDLLALGSLGMLGLAGCSDGGMMSGEPKKYEGGGPLPEMKGEELPDPSSPKGKAKAKKG